MDNTADKKTISLEQLLPLMQEAFSKGQEVKIPVTGVSMRPTLSPGDMVTLLPVKEKDIRRGDILLYRRETGQFVLHRVISVSSDTLTFCGDGQIALERDVPKKAVLARVIAGIRAGKECSGGELRSLGRRRMYNRRLRALATVIHFRLKKS